MNFPAGFMDVISLETGDKDHFRLLYDTKGRYVLHRIDEAEASIKLGRVVRAEKSAKGVPVVVTHDGRTFR